MHVSTSWYNLIVTSSFSQMFERVVFSLFVLYGMSRVVGMFVVFVMCS